MKFFILAVAVIDLIVGGLLTHFGIQPAWSLTIPVISTPVISAVSGDWMASIASILSAIGNVLIFIWNIVAAVISLITFQYPNVNAIITGFFDVLHLGVVLALLPWGN
jgi:phage-related protein